MNSIIRLLLLATCVTVILTAIPVQYPRSIPFAYAHFLGGTTINLSNGYQVRFVPSPSVPAAGDKSTRLNFSVLENNSDIYDVYVSLQVKKTGTGETVASYPYRPHEYSDVSFPLIFNDTGNYNVTIYTLTTGDQTHRSVPLQASFNMQVISPFQAMLMNANVLFVVIVAPIAAGAAAMSIYYWKRK